MAVFLMGDTLGLGGFYGMIGCSRGKNGEAVGLREKEGDLVLFSGRNTE
jgi:hypothetical protein